MSHTVISRVYAACCSKPCRVMMHDFGLIWYNPAARVVSTHKTSATPATDMYGTFAGSTGVQ
jgi:hypothetical protein